MTDRPAWISVSPGSRPLLDHAARTGDSARATREQIGQLHADIARAFEDAVVDTLAIKCRRAVEQTGSKALVMAGGVSANRRLRARVDRLMAGLGGRAYYPREPSFAPTTAR